MSCKPCSLGSLLRPVTTSRPGYSMVSYEHFCSHESCTLLSEDGLCLITESGAILDHCNTPVVTRGYLATEDCRFITTESGRFIDLCETCPPDDVLPVTENLDCLATEADEIIIGP